MSLVKGFITKWSHHPALIIFILDYDIIPGSRVTLLSLSSHWVWAGHLASPTLPGDRGSDARLASYSSSSSALQAWVCSVKIQYSSVTLKLCFFYNQTYLSRICLDVHVLNVLGWIDSDQFNILLIVLDITIQYPSDRCHGVSHLATGQFGNTIAEISYKLKAN